MASKPPTCRWRSSFDSALKAKRARKTSFETDAAADRRFSCPARNMRRARTFQFRFMCAPIECHTSRGMIASLDLGVLSTFNGARQRRLSGTEKMGRKTYFGCGCARRGLRPCGGGARGSRGYGHGWNSGGGRSRTLRPPRRQQLECARRGPDRPWRRRGDPAPSLPTVYVTPPPPATGPSAIGHSHGPKTGYACSSRYRSFNPRSGTFVGY